MACIHPPATIHPPKQQQTSARRRASLALRGVIDREPFSFHHPPRRSCARQYVVREAEPARAAGAGAAAAAAAQLLRSVLPGWRGSLDLLSAVALSLPVRSCCSQRPADTKLIFSSVPVRRSGEETVESAAWCCEQPPFWLQRQCRPAPAEVSQHSTPGGPPAPCTTASMETLHPGGAAAAVSTAFRVFSSMLSVGPNKGLKISPTKAELELDTPHSKSIFNNIIYLRVLRIYEIFTL